MSQPFTPEPPASEPVSASQILAKALDTSALDELAPLDLVRVYSEQLEVLAEEFPTVSLRIDASRAPVFAGILRLGMTERLGAELAAQGIEDPEGAAKSKATAMELPNKIQSLALLHPSVGITLPAETARLLASDLSCGLARRATSQITQGHSSHV